MKKSVMLVDDHPAMLMALKSMLQDQLLFEVVGQCRNGEECLQSVKQINPDIVILDLDMPKTDGFDVIRRISLTYPDIRLLVLSSLDEQVYGGRVRSLGAHGFINKTAGADVSWRPVWRSPKAMLAFPIHAMAIAHSVTRRN